MRTKLQHPLAEKIAAHSVLWCGNYAYGSSTRVRPCVGVRKTGYIGLAWRGDFDCDRNGVPNVFTGR